MRYNIIKACLFLLIGALFMININGCADGFKYTRFSSKDPGLNVAMDYISDWVVREHKGPESDAAGVLFYENIQGDVFKAKISLYVTNISGKKTSLPSIDAMANDLVLKRLKFKEAKVLSSSKIKVLGAQAREIILSYKAMDKLYSVDPRLIAVKERVVILYHGSKFYTVRYDNTEDKFDQLNKAFTHIIKSLRFQDQKT